MYNKYIVLMKLPTGNNSLLNATNESILLPHMLELYNSILNSENITIDKEQVFKIVLDFFKTTKKRIIR